jgi:hypothetical protein
VLSPFLRAKHCWYRDDRREAIAWLEAILGDGALYVSDYDLAASAGVTFEAFVIGLLKTDDHLMMPFGAAIERVWHAFPGRYAIHALELRGERDPEWFHAAAANGLISTDPADHDRVAKVVLVPVPDVIDRARLDSEIAAAQGDGAWRGFIRAHADVTSNLFLDAVFYRARVTHAAMVRDRLTVISEAQPEVIDLVADTLAGWDPEAVARIGMRVESGSRDCATSLIDALRRREFDALPAACLP